MHQCLTWSLQWAAITSSRNIKTLLTIDLMKNSFMSGTNLGFAVHSQFQRITSFKNINLPQNAVLRSLKPSKTLRPLKLSKANVSDLQKCFAKPGNCHSLNHISRHTQWPISTTITIKSTRSSQQDDAHVFWNMTPQILSYRRFGEAARHYLQSPRTRNNLHGIIQPRRPESSYTVTCSLHTRLYLKVCVFRQAHQTLLRHHLCNTIELCNIIQKSHNTMQSIRHANVLLKNISIHLVQERAVA
jgi:hypothetical protein